LDVELLLQPGRRGVLEARGRAVDEVLRVGRRRGERDVREGDDAEAQGARALTAVRLLMLESDFARKKGRGDALEPHGLGGVLGVVHLVERLVFARELVRYARVPGGVPMSVSRVK